MRVSASGDIGDNIAMLSNFHHIAPVELALHASKFPREPYTARKVELVRSFPELQTYIKSVTYSDKPIGLDLDSWRTIHKQTKEYSLPDYTALALRLPLPDRNRAWLQVDRPDPQAPVIINRTCRYACSQFPWKDIVRHYKDIAFIGTPLEHKRFQVNTQKKIRYIHTPTLLDFARVIAGSKLYICNQSVGHWIAVGLDKRTWLQESKCKQGVCYWPKHNTYHNLLERYPNDD